MVGWFWFLIIFDGLIGFVGVSLLGECYEIEISVWKSLGVVWVNFFWGGYLWFYDWLIIGVSLIICEGEWYW